MTGYLADRQLAPSSLVLAGLAVLLVTFPLLGPAPCLPLQPSLALTTACLLTQVDRKIIISGGMHEACSNIYPQGAGSALVVVATYSWCLRSTLAATDLPETVSTFSLVSGLWTSAFALGNFAGPSLAGVIYEQVCSDIGCYIVPSSSI